MWLETHVARSGHIYQHEVTYIIINYLFNKCHVIYKSLQPKYSVLVLKYFSKYLYLYSSTFENPVLVLVFVLVIFPSTCTCTRVLLSSTRPKPAMLRVYGHYKCVNSFSAGTVFRRQNLTSVNVRLWRLKTIPALKGSSERRYVMPKN